MCPARLSGWTLPTPRLWVTARLAPSLSALKSKRSRTPLTVCATEDLRGISCPDWYKLMTEYGLYWRVATRLTFVLAFWRLTEGKTISWVQPDSRSVNLIIGSRQWRFVLGSELSGPPTEWRRAGWWRTSTTGTASHTTTISPILLFTKRPPILRSSSGQVLYEWSLRSFRASATRKVYRWLKSLVRSRG